MYVSITGLTVRGPLQMPLFWWFAVRAMVQAQRSPGNLFADARKVDGVQHTLTIWTEKAAMRRFLTSGAHLGAMKAIGKIGHGQTCGYETDTQPGWDEALAYWRENGRAY